MKVRSIAKRLVKCSSDGTQNSSVKRRRMWGLSSRPMVAMGVSMKPGMKTRQQSHYPG